MTGEKLEKLSLCAGKSPDSRGIQEAGLALGNKRPQRLPRRTQEVSACLRHLTKGSLHLLNWLNKYVDSLCSLLNQIELQSCFISLFFAFFINLFQLYSLVCPQHLPRKLLYNKGIPVIWHHPKALIIKTTGFCQLGFREGQLTWQCSRLLFLFETCRWKLTIVLVR